MYRKNGLPNIFRHDLRRTYCTLLLKDAFHSEAISKLMGHARALITMDVYADNKGIIAGGGRKLRNVWNGRSFAERERDRRFSKGTVGDCGRHKRICFGCRRKTKAMK